MAQSSLYRRHRPKTFEEVVGQEHVVRTLRNAVERDRVHHAYLFVGSRGTGKTSLAKILARSLNCVNGPTVNPCGECESCRGIASGSALDVVEMDAASNRSVDDIRELREQVGYAPAAGNWKVYILDEAHMLTREAWNAFLKTLEEPPPKTVFVLATTEPHKVMPTIVDRCQRFDFARPSVEQIAEVVTRVAAVESITIDDGAIGAISRAASGSFRDALGTLDQLVAYGGNELDTDDVLAVLGVADAELVFAAADAVATGDGAAALRAVDGLGRSGRDPSQYARDLISHLRHLLVLKTAGVAPDSFTVTAGDPARVAAQANQIADTAIVRAIDELSAALGAIREGDDARTALELALLKAARPDLDPSRRALADRVERLERALEGTGSPLAPATAPTPAPAPDPPADGVAAAPDQAPSPPPGPEVAGAGATEPAGPPEPDPAAITAPAKVAKDVLEEARSGITALAEEAGARAEQMAERAEAAVEALDLERVRGMWPAVIEQVRDSGSILLSTLFEAARPVSVDPASSIVQVGFPESAAFNKRKAETEENRERLSDAIRAIVGERLRPVYVVLEGEEASEAEAEAAIESTPGSDTDEELVERFKSAFDAEEISGDDPTTMEAESG